MSDTYISSSIKLALNFQKEGPWSSSSIPLINKVIAEWSDLIAGIISTFSPSSCKLLELSQKSNRCWITGFFCRYEKRLSSGFLTLQMSLKSNDRLICFVILTDSFNLGFPPKPSNSGPKITLKSLPMIISQSASIFKLSSSVWISWKKKCTARWFYLEHKY